MPITKTRARVFRWNTPGTLRRATPNHDGHFARYHMRKKITVLLDIELETEIDFHFRLTNSPENGNGNETSLR